MTEDLLKYCRYYKGEKQLPDNVHSMFWAIEWRWVNGKKQNPKLKDSDWYVMKDYINDGFENFSKDDGVPMLIKALLYEWFQKLVGFKREAAIKSFPKFYNDEYKVGN